MWPAPVQKGLGRNLKVQLEASLGASLEHTCLAPPLPPQENLTPSNNPQKPAPPHRTLTSNLPCCCCSPYICSIRKGWAHFTTHLALRNQTGNSAPGKRHCAWADYTGDEMSTLWTLAVGYIGFGQCPETSLSSGDAATEGQVHPKLESSIPGT